MKRFGEAMRVFDHRRGLLRAICFFLIIIILTAGLWPFNFFPPNKVKWLPDTNGIQIYGQGIIFSASPGWKQGNLLFPDGEMTLELWLYPHQETSNLPAVLSFYDGLNPDIFSLGQWKSHLVIRSRTADQRNRKSGKGYQEIGYRNALLKNKDVFITVVSEKNGTAIFINGRRAKDYPRYRLLKGVTSRDIRLVMGNSPAGQGYWPGNILGMAVYHRALTPDEVAGNYLSWMLNDPYSLKKEKSLVGLYPFYEREGNIVRNVIRPDDVLMIPDVFKPLRKIVLSTYRQNDSKWRDSFSHDIVVNILGFIPWGFFFCMLLLKQTDCRRTTVCLLTIMAGIGLSLLVELTQACLPARDSSLVDLVNNMVGTFIGVFIVNAFVKSRHPGENRGPVLL
ncbi:MAG: VanZ family protein [Deltaproteobacteria bacterium]|nr:VanZ family protein [Deltaproteobacteria bacterium]